jgi:RNA polymerase sigma-70 factor (ECF subfamily)
MTLPDPLSPTASDRIAQADAALFERIRRGDRGAFEALYRRYYRPLFAYLLKLTGRPDAVEELIDDTLLVVWHQADRFAGHSRPSTWIFGIAYRKGLKALSRRQREERRRVDEEPAPVEHDGPERRWSRRELAGRVGEALEELPAEQRAVVVLTYYHGLPYPEIAEILGCPVGTVKTRMFHARRKLALLLPRFGVDRRAIEGL